jgi:hypothetical protein
MKQIKRKVKLLKSHALLNPGSYSANCCEDFLANRIIRKIRRNIRSKCILVSGH